MNLSPERIAIASGCSNGVATRNCSSDTWSVMTRSVRSAARTS